MEKRVERKLALVRLSRQTHKPLEQLDTPYVYTLSALIPKLSRNLKSWPEWSPHLRKAPVLPRLRLQSHLGWGLWGFRAWGLGAGSSPAH